jgi:hypothetical protein
MEYGTVSPLKVELDDTVEVTPLTRTRDREAVDGRQLDLLEHAVADSLLTFRTVDPLEFDGLGVPETVPTAGVGGIHSTDAGDAEAVVRVLDPTGGFGFAVGGCVRSGK